jgi:hypothetical protein
MVEIPASECAWCHEAFHQPATGRRRLYCKRTCRQRAYEERRALEGLGLAGSVTDGTGRAPLDDSALRGSDDL